MTQRIQARTDGRIRQLQVECASERAVVSGIAPSYHVLQLALSASLDVLQALESWHLDLKIEIRRWTPDPAP